MANRSSIAPSILCLMVHANAIPMRNCSSLPHIFILCEMLYPQVATFWAIFILLALIANVNSSIPRSSSGSTLPRVTDISSSDHRPGWNISPNINDQGYLCQLYKRIPGEWEADCPSITTKESQSELDVPVIIRQVPGDGDCLFHSLAISLNLIQGRHLPMHTLTNLYELKEMSRQLRQMAVGCLRSCNECKKRHNRGHMFHLQRSFMSHHKKQRSKKKVKKFKSLFIQGTESMTTSQLLSTAASQYGITSQEYCDLMEQDSYWGGGPEIVALCNVLKRPIHVYELVVSDDRRDSQYQEIASVPEHLVNKQFCLRRMATFGSPKFNDKEPLRILSADSRFPDIHPERITENGNHFMALFPVHMMRRWVNNNNATTFSDGKTDNRQFERVRGGAAASTVSDDSSLIDCESVSTPFREEMEDSWLLHGEWFDDFQYNDTLDDDKHEWDIQQSYRVERYWYRKLFRLHEKKEPRHQVQKGDVARQSMIEYWINVFIRALSRFRIGF